MCSHECVAPHLCALARLVGDVYSVKGIHYLLETIHLLLSESTHNYFEALKISRFQKHRCTIKFGDYILIGVILLKGSYNST